MKFLMRIAMALMCAGMVWLFFATNIESEKPGYAAVAVLNFLLYFGTLQDTKDWE